jgi:two-component system, NarL family, nitrate/nitrite response regulator NarL
VPSTPIHPALPQTVRVMVLADVRLYREGLTRLLDGQDGLMVVGVAPVTEESLLRVPAEHADVVLIEAATACETSVVRDLARLAPETKVVAYGVVDEDRQALRCAEAGVAAFVTGEATGEQLVGAILGVARGEFSCSPRIAALLLSRVRALSQGVPPQTPHARLTPRERAIAALVADGLSNKEIAVSLGIELSTVKNHVHHILEKLHVSRRTQAAARFRSTRLLKPRVPRLSGSGS